ncbi:hypothetical protein BKA63DRAFT_75039 [Paraphoma chrysanthemicola]|nr:hypothetical protein BKA63DRAFT_75039 [Paraphoma chrysanthemicola]
MKLWTALTIAALFSSSVQAQAALQALARQLPACSLACFTSEIPQSTCATNLTTACMCTNAALNAAVGACASQTCTVYELLQTKNISTTSCGVPSVRNTGDKFNAIAYAGIAAAVVSYLLRLAASIPKNGRQMSWDDATMGVVVVLCIPPAVFAPFLVDNGLGRDIWTLRAEQITNVLHFYYAGEIFYVLGLGISKISILFFYLRVFPAKDFRRILWAVMGVCIAYTVAFFFATTFQCIPVSMAWNQWDGIHKGRCNDIHLQGWIAAAINIVLDAIVMVLPLKHLAKLNMNLKRKLMVMSMFSVGIIVILVSVLRLYSLVHFANSKNITWDYVEAGYWSLLEINFSVICGCMPAHRLLIARAWPKIKLTFHSTRGVTDHSTKSTEASRSTASATNKVVNVSVKPKTGDEGDFVPLVNMETRSGSALGNSGPGSDLKVSEWIDRMPAAGVGHTNSHSTVSQHNDHLDDWPMYHSATGEEHV